MNQPKGIANSQLRSAMASASVRKMRFIENELAPIERRPLTSRVLLQNVHRRISVAHADEPEADYRHTHGGERISRYLERGDVRLQVDVDVMACRRWVSRCAERIFPIGGERVEVGTKSSTNQCFTDGDLTSRLVA